MTLFPTCILQKLFIIHLKKNCSYLSFKTGSSEKLITILQRWHLLSDEQKSRKAKVSGCPPYMNHFTMKCTIYLMPFLS